MSCEQIYNLWHSEPEILKVIDLRSREEYDQGHIPGAQFATVSELPHLLSSLGNRLAVLVAPNYNEEILKTQIGTYDNFVFLKNCNRWSDLELPVTSVFNPIKFETKVDKGAGLKNDIIFQQLYEPESSTYSYIIADAKTKEAAIIDPVLETVDRDLQLLEELGLKLIYVLDTHIHADHITGAGEIRKRLGVKTAVSVDAQAKCVDINLEDGQELSLGSKKIQVIATPGHTNTCLSFFFEGMVFTGDALLIRGCGRTDFQQGNATTLFKSVREKLFKLPEETLVYPGHDYRGRTSSTIGTERQFNPRLKDTIDLMGFTKIMAELKLANPKKIHEAVPANLECGKTIDSRVIHPQIVDGIPEISVDDLYNHLDDARSGIIELIDVRRPEEFNNELAHVEGAKLITLGPELTEFLNNGDRTKEIVFICRSGGRSGTATRESLSLGYKFVTNMVGGMIRWNERKLPTSKS